MAVWNNRQHPNVFPPNSLINAYPINLDNRVLNYPSSSFILFSCNKKDVQIPYPPPQNLRAFQDYAIMQQMLNQQLLHSEQAAVLRRIENNSPPVRFPLSEAAVKPIVEQQSTKQTEPDNVITVLNMHTLC